MTRSNSSKGAAFTMAAVLCLMVIVLGSSQVAQADAIYTYTGANFTQFYNGSIHPSIVCSPLCSVSGSFTLATALGANLNNVTISPVSYSFTDGLSTNTNLNSVMQTFTISTDASGHITGWEIYSQINPNHSPCSDNEYGVYTSTNHDLGEISGDLCTSPYDQYAQSFTSGTWTETNSNATPEPASLALLGSGLLGLGAAARRKFIA